MSKRIQDCVVEGEDTSANSSFSSFDANSHVLRGIHEPKRNFSVSKLEELRSITKVRVTCVDYSKEVIKKYENFGNFEKSLIDNESFVLKMNKYITEGNITTLLTAMV